MNLTLATHSIPLWFLVLSLFLPRLCIVIAWFQHTMSQYIPNPAGLLQIIVAVLIPRILILIWIYQDQGIGLWFIIHLVALLMAWGGGGHRIRSRRRGDLVD